MKVPGIDYRAGGVQSLGREQQGSANAVGNAQARAALAQGAAMAVFTEGTAAILGQVHDRQVASDVAAHKTLITEKDLAIRRDMATMASVSVDELTRLGIDPPKSAGGERLEIPMYEVESRYYTARIKQASQQASSDLVLPAAVTQADQWLGQFLARNLPSISKDQIDRQHAASLAKFQNAYTAMVRRGDAVGAERLTFDAVNSRTISRKKAGELRLALPEDLALRQVYDLVAGGTPEAIQAELSRLSAADYAGPLDAKTVVAARTSLRGELEKRLAIGKREFAENHARSLSVVEMGITSGETTALDLRQMADAQQLGATEEKNWSEFTRLSKLHIRTFAGHQAREATLTRVAAAVSGNGFLNPANSADVKAVNLAVDTGQFNDPAAVETIAIKTGILPQKMQDTIEGGILNGDPAQAAQALETYGRLQDTNTWLVHPVSAPAKQLLETAGIHYRGGLSSAKAVEQARLQLDVKPEVRTARKEAYKDLEPDNAGALKELMEGSRIFNTDIKGEYLFSTVDATASANMLAEFDAMTEANYQAAGNLSMAQKVSFSALRESWGVSATGGYSVEGDFEEQPTRTMKHAPERLYGISSPVSQRALHLFAVEKGIERPVIKADDRTAYDRSYAIASYNLDTELYDFHQGRWRPGEYIERAIRELQQEGVDTASAARALKRTPSPSSAAGPGIKNWSAAELMGGAQ